MKVVLVFLIIAWIDFSSAVDCIINWSINIDVSSERCEEIFHEICESGNYEWKSESSCTNQSKRICSITCSAESQNCLACASDGSCLGQITSSSNCHTICRRSVFKICSSNYGQDSNGVCRIIVQRRNRGKNNGK